MSCHPNCFPILGGGLFYLTHRIMLFTGTFHYHKLVKRLIVGKLFSMYALHITQCNIRDLQINKLVLNCSKYGYFLYLSNAFSSLFQEVATRALKLSGNKGVDAALEIIHKLSHQEGRNGFTRAANTGLCRDNTCVIMVINYSEILSKQPMAH